MTADGPLRPKSLPQGLTFSAALESMPGTPTTLGHGARQVDATLIFPFGGGFRRLSQHCGGKLMHKSLKAVLH
jgi:hypothetical protein